MKSHQVRPCEVGQRCPFQRRKLRLQRFTGRRLSWICSPLACAHIQAGVGAPSHLPGPGVDRFFPSMIQQEGWRVDRGCV